VYWRLNSGLALARQALYHLNHPCSPTTAALAWQQPAWRQVHSPFHSTSPRGLLILMLLSLPLVVEKSACCCCSHIAGTQRRAVTPEPLLPLLRHWLKVRTSSCTSLMLLFVTVIRIRKHWVLTNHCTHCLHQGKRSYHSC
jgi:hypothetical protein